MRAYANKCFIYGLRGIDAIVRKKWSQNLAVPGLSLGNIQAYPVVKSVVSNGRPALYLAANQDLKIIHLIRHPCGYVDSVLRGNEMKKMRPTGGFPIKTLAKTAVAKSYGWTEEKLRAADTITLGALYWLFTNETVMAGCRTNDRYMLVKYEDICADPVTETAAMMRFCGFDIAQQTVDFLNASIEVPAGARVGYFRCRKKPVRGGE